MPKTFKYPKHTFMKAGVYYYSRSIPVDLRGFYTRPRIVHSLKTKSAVSARKSACALTAKLDDYWLGLRLKQVEVPGGAPFVTAPQWLYIS